MKRQPHFKRNGNVSSVFGLYVWTCVVFQSTDRLHIDSNLYELLSVDVDKACINLDEEKA